MLVAILLRVFAAYAATKQVGNEFGGTGSTDAAAVAFLVTVEP